MGMLSEHRSASRHAQFQHNLHGCDPRDNTQRSRTIRQHLCTRLRASADASGAAAVEFAIVASIFLVLALGILAYGIYFGAAHSVSQLAADSARASIAGLSDSQRADIAKDHATNHAEDFFMLTRSRLKVEAGPQDAGNQFAVTVSFDASDLPIWFMSGLVPLPSKTIVRSASIKRGGY